MSVDDPLFVDADTMRRQGYAMVDFLVDHLTQTDAPALRRATPAEMADRIPAAPPAGAASLDEILHDLRVDVLPYMSRSEHPRYFAFIPSNGTWPSALGDFLAAGVNAYCGAWMESAGPSQVELTVLRWFADWLGLPSSTAGVLVSGGSAANMTALAAAREHAVGAMTDDVVAYVSDQAHSSLARAARTLGFRPDQLRVIPVDDQQAMRPDALDGAIEADRRAGRRPIFVSAAAGATNSGSVDPLHAIADICAAQGMWMHVDAAYGGFATLTERGRKALQGIERADSVTLDPHKWLYQPFECGAVLVRDGARLRTAFEMTPDYLKDAVVSTGEVNFADFGLQLSRMARAFKIWISIRYFGLDAFRATIDRTLDLAIAAQAYIENSEHLELLLPAQLGIVCFRRRFDGVTDDARLDALNAAAVRALDESGYGLVSSTRLQGRYAIRLCVLNHTSSLSDVESVLAWLARCQVTVTEPEAEALQQTVARSPSTPLSWRTRGAVDIEKLSALDVFAGIDDAALDFLAAACRERTVPAGQQVVRRWDADRDFYVILDGTVEVIVGDEVVRSLGPGEFFGELAATDWGAGYGYPRLADVVATTSLRLLVVPQPAYAVVARLPPVRDRIRSVIDVRLRRS
ncbi:aminotransferase class V-fold PLP-dependent enzyme [Mycolicibacterium sp. 018/SC-01/001]|uniref:aminotransferase class V-fold PLP-dependent enzyme n=1 Tax=Mycolicibacterium sp. 018/SC-01/001 TaxID=2592069 RepID=UPI00117C4B2E|nr:aminotransferase class V-fold PLP-dependent enzyme [Mycolicibacterium sp. 018/SC-01/001]TRW82804.1 aminotransferase class V-fold PLP-dependent enzyme [Mycolicibacterium sp. 018/SC-01/001]